jgi:hypothetical protein
LWSKWKKITVKLKFTNWATGLQKEVRSSFIPAMTMREMSQLLERKEQGPSTTT